MKDTFSLARRTTLARPLQVLLGLGLAAALVAPAAAVGPNTSAPDFTLRTMDGRNLRLQEQRGKVVLINFWATWCGPCRQEMPHLSRLYDKYNGAGFTLLAVNVDEDVQAATALASKFGLKFPVLLDTSKQISKLYDLAAMPSTVVVDRNGKVRYVHRGYRDGYELNYDQQIRDLLKE